MFCEKWVSFVECGIRYDVRAPENVDEYVKTLRQRLCTNIKIHNIWKPVE